MSILREIQENNDTRDEFDIVEVDLSVGSQPISQDPPQPILPPEQPPTVPQQEIVPTTPPDLNNQLPEVLEENNLESATLNQQTLNQAPMMPTVNDVFLKNREVAGQEIDESLNTLPGTYVLDAKVSPTLYEVSDAMEEFNRPVFLDNPPEFLRKQVIEQVTGVSTEPDEPQELGTSGSIKLGRSLSGLIGRVTGSDAFTSAKDFILGGEEPDEDNFQPLRGFKELGQDIQDDPKNIWKLAFALPIGFARGKYGEMGDGLLGSTFYGISLAQNAVVGAATDIYQAINGTRPEGESLNVIQAIKGKDLSFTTQSSASKPLSFVGDKENPETYADLKKRSILWQHPLFSGASIGLGIVKDAPRVPGIIDMYEAVTDVFQSEENKGKIPLLDKLPDRTIQTQEFIIGTIGDALTDPLDLLANVGKKASRHIDVLDKSSNGRLLNPAPDDLTVPGGADADLIKSSKLLPGDSALPSVVPDVSITTIDVDAVDITPNRPQLVAENLQASLEAAMSSPKATVGQLEELLGSTIEPIQPSLRNSDVVIRALPQASVDPSILGLLPGQNTMNDLIARLSKDTEAIKRFTTANDVNLDVFNPITRKANSEFTAAKGLNREPLSSRRMQLALPASNVPANYYDPRGIQKLNTDSFISRVLDNSFDEVVDNPSTIPDILNAQAEVIPDNLVSRSKTGLELTAQTLRSEQLLETFSKEAEGLSARFQLQADELNKMVAGLNELPDIGRRELPIEGVPFRDDYVRPDPSVLEVGGKQFTVTRSPFAQRGEFTTMSIEQLKRADNEIFTGTKDTPIGKRVEGFKDFLTDTDNFNAPEIHIKANGSMVFKDGRHRTKALSELGVENIPVVITRDSSAELDELIDEINTMRLYHGTRTVLPENVSTLDPVLGASRSEIGTVLHVTNDVNVASLYAEAKPLKNQISTVNGQLKKTTEGGLVYSITPSIKKPLDVTANLSPIDRETISTAIDRVVNLGDINTSRRSKQKLKRALREGVSYEKLLNKLDGIFSKEFDDLPEEFILNVQRSIVADLRDNLGYDVLVKRGENNFLQLGFTGKPGSQLTDALLSPTNVDDFVGDIPQTSIQRQSYIRAKTDELTSNLYPDSEFSKVNAIESNIEYASEELSLTKQRMDNTKKVNDIVVSELLEQEAALKELSLKERQRSIASNKKQWDKQNERQIKSLNTTEKGIC